jgi:SAM-dependent MidA family methyltransferase
VSTHDFASITESAPLVADLRQRIARDGAISFRDFMQAALYHPSYGYYLTNAGVTSRGGDYVTSPEVHPVFGALVARQLGELWELMERPAPFRVAEAGAGRGLLARDVIAAIERTQADLARAIAYTIVEPTPMLEHVQRTTIAGAGLADTSVEWLPEMPSKIEGMVLTNELLDAFPVHRVVRRGDDLLEVFVTHDGTRFVEELQPPSTTEIESYFSALGLLPGEGCYAEVNLAARDWIGNVARRLDRGYVLTFDYGYEADALYARWRKDGTLLCCYRQSMSSDPYQRIGKQDITSSIDFTTLRRAGEEAGLRTLASTDQADFLVRMGISEGVTAVAHERPQELEEYFARRNVVMALIDPAGLGRIKVLLQGKGVPEGPFRGFGS